MWPTKPVTDAGPEPLEGGRRRRLLIGLGGLAVAVGAASALSVLARPASSGPVHNTTGPASAVTWTWDGSSFRPSASSSGPVSNVTDMAYDPAARAVVAWDHGCTQLVMGFTGGCSSSADSTWTWDGRGWTRLHPRSSPASGGAGAMVYDSRRGRVLYVNGSGQTWAWSGGDWTSAGGGIPGLNANGAAGITVFAAGYDEGRGQVVIALDTATWTWDGSRWSTSGGAVPATEASSDDHLVYDRALQELVYIGGRQTWTWDGARWSPHAQPSVSDVTAAYDPASKSVLMVQEDGSVWTWDGNTWEALHPAQAPRFSSNRAGAAPAPMVYDESNGEMVLLVSAN